MKKFLLILLASGFLLKINGGEIEAPEDINGEGIKTPNAKQSKLKEHFTITQEVLEGCKLGATCPEDCPLGKPTSFCVNAIGLCACTFPFALLACAVEGARCCISEGSKTAGEVVDNFTKPAAKVLGAIRFFEINTNHYQTNHYINSQPVAQDPQVINPDELLRDALTGQQ